MEKDKELYLAFLQGDERAFETLMKRYQNPLIYFCFRFTHDLSSAEDIAIDVFCYLLLHPRHYHFKTELKTYLFMLARSRCIDQIRRQKRYVPLDSVSPAVPEDARTLEETVLTGEIRRTVHRALKQLPQELQAVVHLIYFEDLSYKETALVLKKSVKQIDNLLYRAKKMLREILGKEGQDLL